MRPARAQPVWPLLFSCALLALFVSACAAAFSPAPFRPTPLPPAPDQSAPRASETPASPILVPIPSPTQAPNLSQLTSGGCCVEPFFHPDGSTVLYLDRPEPDGPSGLWGVPLSGGPPEWITDRLGVYSADMRLLAYPENDQTVVERLEDGQRWVIPNAGRAVSFSPEGERLAWTAGVTGPPFDTALREVWVSRVDGMDARKLLAVNRGGFAGWLPDGGFLVSGRLEPQEPTTGLWVLPPEGGDPIALFLGERMRSTSLSPDGSWLAYQVAFAENPSENGLWRMRVSDGDRLRLNLFGAYRWRNDGHLLVIPLDLDAAFHQVWQVEAATGEAFPLTDPEITPFRIANGDWTVSPDGNHIVFVSAEDHNLWLLTLP